MKAAIYSRKSKFKEEGESIENQINMCVNYAKVNLGIQEFDVFEDEGFSAKNTDRPQFLKMIKNIKNKKYSHFICYRLDRAFRNVSDYSSNMELFKKYDVAFISIKEQFDTTTALGRAMMNVSATFAQLERETTAERIKDNLRELSKTGRWLGGPPPLGYESIEVENKDNLGKSRKKHILRIKKDEINIVKLVFELFEKYKSFQKVSSLLENQGIYSRKGRVFSRELVKQTINNPIYVTSDKKIINYFKNYNCEIYNLDRIDGFSGIMPYNRRKENGSFAPIENWIISIGEHEGVINSETWIRCQNICNKIKEIASNRQCTSQDALLSGLIVCAKCNSGMAPRQNKSYKYHYRYYSCNLRNKSPNRCCNDALNAYDAEEYVIKKLKSVKHEEIIENYNEMQSKKIGIVGNNDLIKNYLKEINNNKKIISNLVLKLSALDNDPILWQPFKDEIKNLTDKNLVLENKINKLESHNEEIVDMESSLDELLDTIDSFQKFYDFTDNFEEKKRLIRSVVKFITWDSDSRKLDVVLVGSSRERPTPFLPLRDSNRGDGSR